MIDKWLMHGKIREEILDKYVEIIFTKEDVHD